MTDALPIPDGVTTEAWNLLAKRDGKRWSIVERNEQGEVIGTAYRQPDGSKTCKPGGKRGLILDWPLKPYAGSTVDDPVFISEGASDCAALLGLSLDAVGVPMAGACGDMLAQLLADRHVCIIADADQAGRNGARTIADALLDRCASVKTIEPPEGAKDARAAVIAGATRDDFLQRARETTVVSRSTGAGILAKCVRLSDVVPERIDWLWPGRIALGKLTMIAGDPGLGKSFLTMDIASRVTTGRGWPDDDRPAHAPGGVVLLGAEDGIADTVVPRLIASGADVSRIIALQAVNDVGPTGKATERAFDLGRDIGALRESIESVGQCALVVVDPVTAYMGTIDSHKNADVRSVLAPLSTLADQHHVAIVCVTHLNKAQGGPAVYRTMGSLAFAAAARGVLAVVKDQSDPSRRILVPVKSNIAKDTTGLAYRIVDTSALAPTIQWDDGPVHISADDAMNQRADDEGGSVLADCKQWLEDMLSGGPVEAAAIFDRAAHDGFSKRTVNRAKAELGVQSKKGGFGAGWSWQLSGSTKTPTPHTVATLASLASLVPGMCTIITAFIR